MENYFDKEFELRFFEMNRLGEASPIAILTLLQETAAEHCHYAGHNLLSLMSGNNTPGVESPLLEYCKL